MEQVERYDFEDYGTNQEDGRYVKHEDYVALQQSLQELKEFREMIFSTIGVHDSNENFVARVNIENALRRSGCLSAIEHHFTIQVEDEEYDGEMMEECPLNWGQEPSDYIETFKSVLNAVRAEGVEMFADERDQLRKIYFAEKNREMAIAADHCSMVARHFADQLRADATKGGSDD